MTAYADSGFLIALYVKEAFSPVAFRLVETRPLLILNPLHRTEFVNALALRRLRKESGEAEAEAVMDAFHRHQAEGIYRIVDWPPAAWEAAERLSQRHTPALGTRTLDVLHVAAALAHGPDYFYSFDRRQRRLAAAEGLRVLPRALAPASA